MSVLVFGATGSIGTFICKKLHAESIRTIKTTSNIKIANEDFVFVDNDNVNQLLKINNVSAVIWAHGINTNDNINDVDVLKTKTMFDVNVCFILTTLKFLLDHNKLNNNANLIIVSSIWEHLTRENKLSYSITKAGLSNLVKSLSFDLSYKHILVNNICPGPVENDMTMATLSSEELDGLRQYTGFNRLINLEDIWNIVHFLLFKNTAITGQSIVVDLGFLSVRKYK